MHDRYSNHDMYSHCESHFKQQITVKPDAAITGMLLPKITICQLQDFHLSNIYQYENVNRFISIQHIVTHDTCMRS